MFPYRLLIKIGIIIISILSRSKKVLKGSKIRPSIIFGITVISSVFLIYVLINSFLIGIPVYYVIPYFILFMATIFLSERYSDSTLKLWKENDGSVYFKIGIYHLFIYIVSILTDIILASIFLGSFSFRDNFARSRELISQDPSVFIPVIILLDSLGIVCLAMMIGVNRKILLRYKNIKSRN